MTAIYDGNAVINGNFDIWQWGTTTSVTGGYAADRWRNVIVGAATQTVSQQAFTVGQTDVPNEPRYYVNLAADGSANTGSDTTRLEQRMESVRTFAGKTVSVDFWARRSSGTGDNIQVLFVQVFGTGGSPSSAVSLTNLVITLTDVWQRFVLLFDIPSISGKTLGTNNDDNLALIFRTSFGVSFAQVIAIDLAQVQVRQCYGAHPYQPRSVAEELFLCQRFMQKSFAHATAPAQNVGVNTGELIFPATAVGALTEYSQTVQFYVPMRTVPAISFYNTAATNAQVRDNTAGADCAATVAVNASQGGFVVTATGNAATVVGNDLRVHWRAQAEL